MQDAFGLSFAPPTDLTGQTTPELGEHTYDFYRCERCTAIVTRPQMVRGLANQTGITVCPCGGLQFRPTNPHPIEYLLPRVIAFAWSRLLEKVRGLGA